MGALFEEGAAAEPMAEVVVLSGRADGGGAAGDGGAVDEDFDCADVAGEVSGVIVVDLATNGPNHAATSA